MSTKKEVRYTDMTEKELDFLLSAAKHRIGELKNENKRLRGQLAQVRVMRYMGEVQHA
jgi:hypothetical protein